MIQGWYYNKEIDAGHFKGLKEEKMKSQLTYVHLPSSLGWISLPVVCEVTQSSLKCESKH